MSNDGDGMQLDPDLVTDSCENHTPCPSGYVEWHDWAEKKMETHKAIKCRGCGLYAIWTPRKEGLTDEK